jgi:hypothetical protein
MSYIARIRENSTLKTRDVAIDENFNPFQWQSGNYSCDCNRRMFFVGVERPIEDHDWQVPCTTGKYSVNVYSYDVLIYQEFDELDYSEWSLSEIFEVIEDLKQRVLKLQHFKDTHVGLWATDRPDLVKDPFGVLFQVLEEGEK